MRTIKVKEGKSKYKLLSDEGAFIGELLITFNPSKKTCYVDVLRKAATIDTLSLGRG